ncbi:MAG: hypothetical protein Kow0056_14480 [Coriobacteriia bacterium]
MRIVAIDASALGGGSVSAAIEAAAQAAEGTAIVSRYRLYSMPAGHGIAEAALAAQRGFEETIAAVVEEILGSDGVILGTPATPAGPNAATRALLKRLAVCFAGHCLERGHRGRPTRLSPGRRVGLLTSSASTAALLHPAGAALTTSLRVRRTFGLGGVRLVGHVAIANKPGHPLARDRSMEEAARLGRRLVGALESDCVVIPAWAEEERRGVGRLVRTA